MHAHIVWTACALDADTIIVHDQSACRHGVHVLHAQAVERLGLRTRRTPVQRQRAIFYAIGRTITLTWDRQHARRAGG